VDSESLKIWLPFAGVILVALIALIAALIPTLITVRSKRKEAREANDVRARVLLQSAKNSWREAARVEMDPPLEKKRPRKPDQPMSAKERRAWNKAQAEESKRERIAWERAQKEKLNEREILIERCKDELYSISNEDLPSAEHYRGAYEYATTVRVDSEGLLPPTNISMQEVEAKLAWEIYRRGHSLKWKILNIPLPQWPLVTKIVAAWLQAETERLRLNEVADHDKALRHAPRSIQMKSHPTWNLIKQRESNASIRLPRETGVIEAADAEMQKEPNK
jgi:hypothetical protein